MLNFSKKPALIENKPALKEIAEMMHQSAKVWSEIASGFLPDSWPTLRRIKELIIEKNRLFEEQEPGTLEAMRKINEELGHLTGKAVEDLQKPPIFLAAVRQSILKCYEVEKEAFNICVGSLNNKPYCQCHSRESDSGATLNGATYTFAEELSINDNCEDCKFSPKD